MNQTPCDTLDQRLLQWRYGRQDGEQRFIEQLEYSLALDRKEVQHEFNALHVLTPLVSKLIYCEERK